MTCSCWTTALGVVRDVDVVRCSDTLCLAFYTTRHTPVHTPNNASTSALGANVSSVCVASVQLRLADGGSSASSATWLYIVSGDASG
ncbi:unnamed protein product [Sphagnum balticum]